MGILIIVLGNIIQLLEELIMNIDFSNAWVQGILIAAAGTILAAIVTFLYKLIRKSGGGFVSFLSRKSKQKTGLDLYRQTLEEETLQISHPWMKEDQTLSDILVDVNFELKGKTEKIDLQNFLRQTFKTGNSPRILILGKPGSGKSIAMRVIAKLIWDLLPGNPIVPVILNFSDIKGLHTHEELKRAIIQKLEYYQFEKGNINSLAADNFVEENLFSGKILLLIDGYDELDKSNRATARILAKNFLSTFRNIPAVLSSRDAVYERELAFDSLTPIKVHMAPFTPFAVLKFLSQWNFNGGKSARDLFNMIYGRAHLSELASNPLMLTIIAFLYSLPKYTLPDNRVQFYEQCTRALLAEWDRARDVTRANKFESHQKTSVLSKIAFEQITIAKETDEFISQEKVHLITQDEMNRLGLKKEEYSTFTNEIVQNSGLLQFITPSDYRFPHRTFMEYFAANYIDKQSDYKELLYLYNQDPDRWKQTLLLYLGLNEYPDYTKAILNHLKAIFINSWNDINPQTAVFDGLTECAAIDSVTASQVLDIGKKYLVKKKFHPDIVEQLGYIAANPRWEHAGIAKEILLQLLDSNLSDNNYQSALLALLHSRDNEIEKIIIDSLNRINLEKIILNLGTDGAAFINRLFTIDLSKSDKEYIIEGLRESGKHEILGSILIENKDIEIKETSAFALLKMSKLNGFMARLSTLNTSSLDSRTTQLLDDIFSRWGWHTDNPTSIEGQKVAILICYYAAKKVFSEIRTTHKNAIKLSEELKKTVEPRLIYLTSSFLTENGIPFHEYNLLGENFSNVSISIQSLQKHWKKFPNYFKKTLVQIR